jgi:hypothetical protein
MALSAHIQLLATTAVTWLCWCEPILFSKTFYLCFLIVLRTTWSLQGAHSIGKARSFTGSQIGVMSGKVRFPSIVGVSNDSVFL